MLELVGHWGATKSLTQSLLYASMVLGLLRKSLGFFEVPLGVAEPLIHLHHIIVLLRESSLGWREM